MRPGEADNGRAALAQRLPDPGRLLRHPARQELAAHADSSEPLRSDVIPGNELTSYSGAVLAFLFIFIVPAYGAFASRVNRIRLINGMTLFFVSNLLIFYALANRPDAGARLRDHLLPVGRHLQPDGDRAVLVVRQRSLHPRGGQAPVRDRRALAARWGRSPARTSPAPTSCRWATSR